MGLTESRENVKGGDHVMILLDDDRDSAWTGLLTYFRQPIIYFYCALPLLAPSLILILVPALDPRCSRTYLALGCFLFSLCVTCFITGLSQAIFNRWSLYSRQALLQEEDKKRLVLVASSSVASTLSFPRTGSSTLTVPTLSSSSSITCSSSSSNLSSRRSSRSSRSRSSSASSTASSSGGKIRAKPKSSLNKNPMRRKRGVKFTVERLPSLIEEDTMVRSSLSRGNSQAAFQQESLPQSAGASGRRTVGLASPVSKDNIEELKDYLNVLGLGGGARRELLPPAGTKMNDCRHAKSFDERDLSRGTSREAARPGCVTSRENSATRKSLTPRPDHAILVTSSHERTGIGMPSIR